MDWQLNKFLLYLCVYDVCVLAHACHDVEARGWLVSGFTIPPLHGLPGLLQASAASLYPWSQPSCQPCLFLSGLPSSALSSLASAESPCSLQPPSCFLWNSHLLTFELEIFITWSSCRWNSRLFLLRTEVNWSSLPSYFKFFLFCRSLAFPLCQLETSIKMSL